MKKSLLAIALLFSAQSMNASFETADILGSAVIVGLSIMSNNSQSSALKMDAALYPEQSNIYESDNLSAQQLTTNLFAGLSIVGLIACRVFKTTPILTGSALSITALSALSTYMTRLNIENEAAIVRLRNARNNK